MVRPQTQVLHLLEQPGRLPEQKNLTRARLLLRLWHYSAFESYVVWLIYVLPDESYLLREAVWDRPRDSARLMDPLFGLKQGFHTRPTVTVRNIPLAPEPLTTYLNELKAIYIPPFVGNGTIGCDGETFGIETGDWFGSGRISWWCEGPEEWQDAITWFHKTTDFLVESLTG